MHKIRDSHRDAKEYPLLHKKYAKSNSNFVCSTRQKSKTLSEYTQRGFFLFLCRKKLHQKCTKCVSPPRYIRKRGNNICHSPLQVTLFISSKISFHHVLPGLICDSNIWFHSLIVLMSSVGHHQLWRPPHFKCMNYKCSSCSMSCNNIT